MKDIVVILILFFLLWYFLSVSPNPIKKKYYSSWKTPNNSTGNCSFFTNYINGPLI